MIFTELQTYLSQQQKASLAQLASHFGTDASALRGMLQRLVHKGRIRQFQADKCGSCDHCDPSLFEFYEWLGPQPREETKQ